MSRKTKNAALAVASLASVFAVGQTVANAASYTVQKGDNLSKIASKFNLTVDDLISTNKISDKNMIFTNQKLEVSNAHSETPANSGAQTAAQKAAAEAKAAAKNNATTQVASKAPVADKNTDTDTETAATTSQKAVETAPKQDVQADVTPAKTVAAQTQEAAPATPKPTTTKSTTSGSGSTYDQFIANGGTDAMWQTIVQPESGGNPNAVSANGYTGLGQTKESWGSGSVAEQTKGMVDYATSRYGSVEQAVSFRQSNGWW